MKVSSQGIFPGLVTGSFSIDSPFDTRYNCTAWAVGDTTRYWDPSKGRRYYWLKACPRNYSVESYRKAFEQLGYKVCDHDHLEKQYEKIALFAKNGEVTHAARQLACGEWTSKIGTGEDIRHALRALCGDPYGDVALVMKRRTDSTIRG